MSLIFYYAPMSSASITEGVLAELGVACERIRLDIGAGDTRKPDFLKINPNGRVPAIVHDGTPIWESAAITMYLGEMFGVDAKLYPAAGPRRGEAMKWIVWSNVTLMEAGSRLSQSLPAGSAGAVEAGSRDEVAAGRQGASGAETARADLAGGLGILDGGLEGKSFMLGEYSLADAHVQSIVGWLGMMQTDLRPFLNVTGWMGRCSERPALAKLMEG